MQAKKRLSGRFFVVAPNKSKERTVQSRVQGGNSLLFVLFHCLRIAVC
jgi:hypothetical protein